MKNWLTDSHILKVKFKNRIRVHIYDIQFSFLYFILILNKNYVKFITLEIITQGLYKFHKYFSIPDKMAKSSFQQVYDKTIKFYDFHYHLHKSTFKGLASIMKNYSDCQKSYAQKLLDISKNSTKYIQFQVNSYVPDLSQQMPAVKNSLNDFVESVSTFSQLHFNYSQRLSQVSNSLVQQYNLSRRLKQKHMKLLKDQYGQNLQQARESKIKSKIISQESHVCKTMYEHLDTYAEEESGRTQKLKEQLLIYFALTKKIQERELEMTTKYKGKISQEEVQIKINQIDQISQNLIDQYNSYLQSAQEGTIQRLSLKKYDRMQSVQIVRQSLKQSTILRQKISNLDGFKSRVRKSLEKYQRLPERLMQFNLLLADKHSIIGLFDKNVLKQHQKYSNLLKSETILKLSFDMLSSFYSKNKQSQTKLFLNTIKGNLKIRSQSKNQHFKCLSDFVDSRLSKRLDIQIDVQKSEQRKNYLFNLAFITMLNQIYFVSQEQFREKDSFTEQTLMSYLKSRQTDGILTRTKHTNQLHINISSVITKSLLSSLIIINEDEPLLIDEYVEYLKFIQKFAIEFLNIGQNIVKLLFLQLLQNYLRSTKSKYIEQIYLLIQNSSSDVNRKQLPVQNHGKFQHSLVASIVINVTQGIVSFYKLGIPLINFFSILICIENLASNRFSAVEYFHKCIKRAGYAYIFWVDQEKKIIQPAIWQGQMRLKNLVQTLQMLEYSKLQETHFVPTASQMSRILGVDQKVILKKLKQQLLEALGQIIEQNMDLLVQEEGIDKQGYILKLGVFLVQLDIPGFKKLDFQTKYFKVLDLYLTNTQRQYNTLLDHSRKTQLWIMQENTLATQNCIDFCSLLYKPFQFLLSTLKLLSQQNKTSFSQQFNQFIKTKLNTILKDQICKYINFLSDSLRQYSFQQAQIHYKPKKGQGIMETTEDDKAKARHLFKQIVRRLYNLNFLKDQLNEIIHDFLEEQVSEDLGASIFNLSNLSKATSKYKQYRQILTNLKDIVQTIVCVQQKLIFRVSDITIFHFMRRLFHNLYFQIERSTFEQFFSTKNDYKFSPYTLVNYQKEFQEVFVMMEKHVPTQVTQKYYPRFTSGFFKALRLEILNTCKFKLPKSKQEIVSYLDEDTSFICTSMKQKYIPPQIVEQELQRPLKKLFASLQASTKDLLQKFQAQTLANNNDECKYVFIILYMRTNDQKAQQFVKKYKSIVFK